MKQSAPRWSSPDVFPGKPSGSVFGFIDTKGTEHPAESLEELSQKVKKSRHGVDYVWSPYSEYLMVPEELEGLDKVLRTRRRDWARQDKADGIKFGVIFAGVCVWTGISVLPKVGGDWEQLLSYPTMGISLLLFFLFGFLPFYEGSKVLREGKTSEKERKSLVDEGRFDYWVSIQPTLVAKALVGLLVLTGGIQLLVHFTGAPSFLQDGVLKSLHGGQPRTDGYRYFTTAFLHGNLLHWLMNASALLYLARRTEVLARWPHLVIVYLAGLIAGGMASVQYSPATPTVGASGAILALLGFLVVFESLHRRLVPRSAQRRLAAGVVMTVVMGVLGFSFIDNAAHAGGFLAGAGYAWIAFPRSESVKRPRLSAMERYVGAGALGILICSALGTAYLLGRVFL